MDYCNSAANGLYLALAMGLLGVVGIFLIIKLLISLRRELRRKAKEQKATDRARSNAFAIESSDAGAIVSALMRSRKLRFFIIPLCFLLIVCCAVMAPLAVLVALNMC